MSLTTDVMDLLDALGDTADQVAAELERLGITGVREQGCACPVFNYLASKDVPVADVGDEKITFLDGSSIDTPPQITEFIYGFDQGEFPTLEEPCGVAL